MLHEVEHIVVGTRYELRAWTVAERRAGRIYDYISLPKKELGIYVMLCWSRSSENEQRGEEDSEITSTS